MVFCDIILMTLAAIGMFEEKPAMTTYFVGATILARLAQIVELLKQ